MYDAGMEGVDDNICKACHAEVGTLYHSCCSCQASAALMKSSGKHRDILHTAQSCSMSLQSHHLLWPDGAEGFRLASSSSVERPTLMEPLVGVPERARKGVAGLR